MIRILMRVDRGQVWLYVLLISPRRRLRYDDACAETKVLLDAGQPLTPGKSESESPEGGKHQTVLIESGRREEDAGSEEAG